MVNKMEWLTDKMVVANWKMYGSMEDTISYVGALNDFYNSNNIRISCVVCPAYLYLDRMSHLNNSKQIFIGGQHCSPNEVGAYTGDVSAAMLADVGCKFTIVAHSERRHFFKETYRMAKHQCIQAMKSRLTPILCVGEIDRDDYEMTLTEQLEDAAVTSLKGRIIIAYEPVWAIGNNTEPDSEHIKKAVALIRNIVPLAPVFYGGSVKSTNVKKVLDITDGVLVGSASINCGEFCNIIAIANDMYKVK